MTKTAGKLSEASKFKSYKFKAGITGAKTVNGQIPEK